MIKVKFALFVFTAIALVLPGLAPATSTKSPSNQPNSPISYAFFVVNVSCKAGALGVRMRYVSQVFGYCEDEVTLMTGDHPLKDDCLSELKDKITRDCGGFDYVIEDVYGAYISRRREYTEQKHAEELARTIKGRRIISVTLDTLNRHYSKC